MSRIWKLPVPIHEKVQVDLNGDILKVTWPLGELTMNIHSLVDLKIEEKEILVEPKDINSSLSKSLWWTTRSLIENMIVWVVDGFSKSLEINGVGYKMEVSGTKLILSIWYSHKVEMEVPQAITMKADEKKKDTIVHFSSYDKQLLWEFVSKVRAQRKPEPYKWKGIKYLDEIIRRKAGKTAK